MSATVEEGVRAHSLLNRSITSGGWPGRNLAQEAGLGETGFVSALVDWRENGMTNANNRRLLNSIWGALCNCQFGIFARGKL
jgi:hypothetical protein